MPIYEYRCQSCGHIAEVWAKLSDPPPSTCENCGAEGQQEKIISRSAFHLKGGGWYAEGYSGDSNGGKSKSSSSSSDSSSSDSSSSSSSTSSSSSSTSTASSSSSDD
ncbi:MAG: FmdB family zinc ribbon protein [Bradymonadia bacterium]